MDSLLWNTCTSHVFAVSTMTDKLKLKHARTQACTAYGGGWGWDEKGGERWGHAGNMRKWSWNTGEELGEKLWMPAGLTRDASSESCRCLRRKREKKGRWGNNSQHAPILEISCIYLKIGMQRWFCKKTKKNIFKKVLWCFLWTEKLYLFLWGI